MVSPEDVKFEERRQRVLKMLDDKPNVHRAFVTDTESDARHVIVTIAIRGVASFEMLIPMDKYDPFLMLELLGSAGVQ